MLFNFYKTLYYFYNNNNINCNYFKYHENEPLILIHLYNLYLIFKLWDLPHYRNKTYGDDINKNLHELNAQIVITKEISSGTNHVSSEIELLAKNIETGVDRFKVK